MNDSFELILGELSEQQKDIVTSVENLLVTACPGSGKTRVLTRKLAYTALSHPQSWKKNIAITYTNRAADEIKDRLEFLDVNQSSIWVGTIHQFCLEYIIHPYSMFLPQISRGFKILNEYVRGQRIKDVLNELNISMPFYERAKIKTALGMDMDITEEKYPEVVKRYHEVISEEKEIDFDLILSLSCLILATHPIASKNIANVIRSIYIDEYQDTNELQYQIIGILAKNNSNINLMFVGDTDQAIYGNLGGVAKNIEQIMEITQLEFSRKTLSGCYRSTQRIIDYYSYFQNQGYVIASHSPQANIVGTITLDSSINKDYIHVAIAEIIKKKIENDVPQNEICVIAPQWMLLYPLSKTLRELLPEIEFDAPDISPIKADEMSVFYKLSKLIFTKAGEKVFRRKRIATEILRMLTDEFGVMLQGDIDCFWLLQKINSIHPSTSSGMEYYRQTVEEFLSACRLNKLSHPALFDMFDNFLLEMADRMERFDLTNDLESFKKMFKEKTGVVITSCHKIKGEEYNTVIAFGLLHGKIPHWDTIYNRALSEDDEAKKMLYVIASRAKESLYFFAENGRTTKKGEPLTLTKVLDSYKYQYD